MPGLRCLNCFQRSDPSPALVAKDNIKPAPESNKQDDDPQNEQQTPKIHGDSSRLGSKVALAIGRLGKQRPSGGFLDEEGRISASHCKRPTNTKLPAETVKPGLLWSIKGVYMQQALSIGIRQLDSQQPTDQLLSFPTGRGRLLKQKFFVDLFEGSRDFQSFPAADISAAQPDLQRLSVRQLLRLRALLLDVSIGSCSSSATAFVESLDALLQKKLGLQFEEGLGEKLDSTPLATREALAMTAAAESFEAPSSWWVWWVQAGSREQRVYFNAKTLRISRGFPSVGALEVTDFSKPDHSDPTSTWMDWQVRLQRVEGDVKAKPPLRSQQAGVAGIVSPRVLEEGREQLRSFNKCT